MQPLFRNGFLYGVSVLALVAGVGIASAQQPAQQPATPAQQPAVNDGKQLQDPKPEQDQKNAQETPSGKLGTIEPSALAPTEKPKDAAVLVDGKLTAPGSPADSQTVPAKYSPRNAELDELPTMAFPLPLTNEQKQQIFAALSKSNAPVANLTAKPADQLPSSVALNDMPADATQQVPWVKDFKFVKLTDKVLLVSAPNMIVIGEISK
jgi:hypothetical protein